MTLPLATALHNAGVITVHGCLPACSGGPHIRECEDLRNAIEVVQNQALCKLCHRQERLVICGECVEQFRIGLLTDSR